MTFVWHICSCILPPLLTHTSLLFSFAHPPPLLSLFDHSFPPVIILPFFSLHLSGYLWHSSWDETQIQSSSSWLVLLRHKVVQLFCHTASTPPTETYGQQAACSELAVHVPSLVPHEKLDNNAMNRHVNCQWSCLESGAHNNSLIMYTVMPAKISPHRTAHMGSEYVCGLCVCVRERERARLLNVRDCTQKLLELG